MGGRSRIRGLLKWLDREIVYDELSSRLCLQHGAITTATAETERMCALSKVEVYRLFPQAKEKFRRSKRDGD